MSTIYKVRGIYQYSYHEDGKRRKKSLRCKDKKIAEILKARLDLQLSKQAAGLSTDKDIQEYLAWYEATHFSNYKPFNTKKELRIIKRFIRDAKVSSLSQISSERIHHWLLGQKISAKTWNNIRGVIRTFLSKAVPKHLQENPVNKIPLRKVPEHGIDFYTDEEYLRIEEEAGKVSPQIRDMIVVARYTGLRIGEILHLEGEDIIWKPSPVLRVRNKPEMAWTVKNYQTRAIPLSREIVAKLRHFEGKTGLLFPNSRGTVHKHFHESYLNEILKAAGVKRPGRAWHLLRHTFISRGAQNGVPLFVLGKWAGHKDFKTTMRYSHLAPEYSPEIEKINLGTATDFATA